MRKHWHRLWYYHGSLYSGGSLDTLHANVRPYVDRKKAVLLTILGKTLELVFDHVVDSSRQSRESSPIESSTRDVCKNAL